MKKKQLRGGSAKLSATEASGALNAGWRDLRLKRQKNHSNLQNKAVYINGCIKI